MAFKNYVVGAHAAEDGYLPISVAAAYNYPIRTHTGKGFTCGIIELGGGFGQNDLNTYFSNLGQKGQQVEAVLVDGGVNQSDGPNGADGEVLLDIEVAGSVAPGANFRVYFAPNTDEGFLAAIEQAVAECDVVSISWGGPETEWDPATIDKFDAAFLKARQNGVIVFAAAGDSGSDDGTGTPTVDFPASSPNVVGCGGTRLVIDSGGTRESETVWNDNSRTSATGGGVSKHFPGRQVPDVAGNADPDTGYQVLVDGQKYVIGGTSAVAPLYAGLALLLSEELGTRLGSKADFMNTLLTNPGVCFDVTSGNNGAYRAGPGRDETTGLGVVDAGKLLAVLTDTTPDPNPVPTPGPSEDPDQALWDVAGPWAAKTRIRPDLVKLQSALNDWHNRKTQG